jgi:hypothetical protein
MDTLATTAFFNRIGQERNFSVEPSLRFAMNSLRFLGQLPRRNVQLGLQPMVWRRKA